MANDQKLEQKPATKSELLRSAVSMGEQINQTATEAGTRMGEAAAQSGSRLGQAAADTGAELGRSMTGQASAMSHEFMRLFGEMKLPNMPDVAGLMEAHRRNLEALAAANRVALEGAQAVARRHMEITQQTMQSLGETMRHLASPEAPQAKAARQAELLKQSYEQAIRNMREMRDMIQHANGEALELLNRRFTESMDEAKGLLEKTQTSARPV